MFYIKNFALLYPIGYNSFVYRIKQTETFHKWLHKLKDIRGKIAIARRIERMQNGNFGDFKQIGLNLFELRITTGPGYRIYFTKKEDSIIILLNGGDKSSQTKDIKKALKLLKEVIDD